MQELIEATSSSLEALGQRFQAITHNLANAGTVGYKRRRSLFLEVLSAQGAAAASGDEPAAGKVAGKTVVDFSQGALRRTGRPLDLALEGKGFLVLETPEGERYTRNGTFTTNARGQLVDVEGRTVAGTAGPIIIPATVSASQVHVASDGGISAAGQDIGRLRVVTFEDSSVLQSVGRGCFRAPESVRASDATDVAVHQGFQESSNVSVVEELVNLITVTRLYEANLKSIQTQDDRMKSILDVAMS